MIDKKVVKHIANLSRLSLSEEETDSFAGQLGSILEYMEQLNRADTSGVEPTSFVAPQHDPLRDDRETASLPVEEILKNGPKVQNNHFSVPKVINQ
jgi:aspartyl-tRNA(Asn)/glutamyl-tRNA(Gln) amidotransferase subunit C